MSSVAVPRKMVPVPNIYGVEAFKEIKPEIVALRAVQHSDTVFTTIAQNRIAFRIPAYSNALLDTARSFLYFKAAAYKNGMDGFTAGTSLAPGAPVFSRMVVKTSAGLTIEDIADLDILSTLTESLKPMDTINNSLYGNTVRNGNIDFLTGQKKGKLPPLAASGTGPDFASAWGKTNYKEILYRFNIGVFSSKLSKFLPLFMADGGAGYSFDVELYLSDRGLHQAGELTTDPTKLAIKDPIWYLHLVRMDEGLARRFNQMAVHGEEIRIPFVTYHTHRASIQAKQMLAYIHENATNFKKILTCINKPSSKLAIDTADGPGLSGMRGGCRSDKNKVTYYNYRIGVQHVYNEPVEELASNHRTLEFVRSAFGVPDNMVMSTQIPAQNANEIPFETDRWLSVASFDYSPGDESVIQGVSSSNPIELTLKFDDPTFEAGDTLINFCELAYDLVFKGGAIHYEEQKPGSQSVY